MPLATLHYIYDPLCGWCYGSSPLVKAARDVEGLEVVLHGGGMLAGARRQLVTEQLREFVSHHIQRITDMTGQPFGDAYTNGLMRDGTVLLDSEPPTAAILAVETATGRGGDMLARLQHLHYVAGRRVFDRASLAEIAGDIGIERQAFEDAFAAQLGSAVQNHISDSRRLLMRVGGQGFPTFVLEHAGALNVLDNSRWMGNPDGWRTALVTRLGRAG